MLTLSIPSQNHFGSPNMSPTSSPTSSSRSMPSQPILRPPTLMNPRRSMMPQVGANAKRPKLSLQTSVLPQPVNVAPSAPVPSSADTPTARNTFANSFRSPGPEAKSALAPESAQPIKTDSALPYGVESVRESILKNTPLENLIRSRKQEKKTKSLRARITFVEEPQVIPRPPQDFEPDVEEAESDSNDSSSDADKPETATTESPATPAQTTPGNRPRSDSAQWRRMRMHRSANEGREMRRGASSTPVSTNGPSKSDHRHHHHHHHQSRRAVKTPTSPVPSDSSEEGVDHYRPPQTPETPSPAHTRDWVWTLGDDFDGSCPYTPPDSGDNSRRSSATADESISSQLAAPSSNSSKASVPVVGGRLPDTPKTATPVTPMTPARVALPETPVSASDRDGPAVLRLQTRGGARRKPGGAAGEAMTPRSVPLPDTPGPWSAKP